MFTWSCVENVSALELFLYGGPETVEKTFGREESFIVPHIEGRSLDVKPDNEPEFYDNGDLWYSLHYDEATGEITRIVA